MTTPAVNTTERIAQRLCAMLAMDQLPPIATDNDVLICWASQDMNVRNGFRVMAQWLLS
jgi:hypothetical protein